MGTVSSIADRPRPIGSPRSDEVRDLLAGRLRAEGAEVEIQRAASAGAAGGTGVIGRVDNVVGMLPGTDPTGAVVLAAHYDSVAAGPGAADDAAGVAAVLETVRALTQGSPLRNDVVVLLTDGEEDGLFGARAFARDDPLRGRPAVVLNSEARGVSGPSMLVRTSPGNQRLVGALAAAAPHAAGDSALNETFRFVPNDTDVSQFLAVGRPALDFAIFEDAGRYHTPEDTPENLSEASLQHHGSTLLGLAGALGGTDLAPFDPVAGATPPVGDATYFPFLGAFVTYPDTWVVPIAALAALAVAGAAAVTARRSLLTVPRVMAGTASVALPVVVAGLLGQGLWTALLALRPAYGDAFLPGFLLRPLPTELAVLALAAAALAGWGLLLGRRVGAWALGVGGLVWLVLLGAVTALLAPGMSFLFALPALGGALGVLVAGLLRGAARPVTIAIGAVPSVAVLWPFVLATFDAGLSSAPAAAALAVLFGAPLAPLAASLRPRWPVAAVPLVVALALATAGLVIDRPDAEHPQQADLAYLLDTADGSARWVSHDLAPAPWTAGYVPDGPHEPGPGLPWTPGVPVRTGPAPHMDLPAPQVQAERRPDGTIALTVASARGATTVGVRSTAGVTLVEATFDGLGSVDLDLRGAPTDLRISDVPPGGIRLVLHPTTPGPIRFEVRDETVGFDVVRGFTPRPPELSRSSRPTGDTVVVSTSLTV